MQNPEKNMFLCFKEHRLCGKAENNIHCLIHKEYMWRYPSMSRSTLAENMLKIRKKTY